MVEQRFRLVGDADMVSAPAISDDLNMVIAACADDIVIDCTGLRFIDSSGIDVLVQARNLLDLQGRRLRIVNMKPLGRRAIEVLGLLDLLGVDGDRADGDGV